MDKKINTGYTLMFTEEGYGNDLACVMHTS